MTHRVPPSAIVVLIGIAGCGSSATFSTRSSTPAVIATTTTRSSGSLPFTNGPTAADRRFASRLEARCRPIASAAARLAQPNTLSDQASFSGREVQLLMRFLAALGPPSPPGDLALAVRSYRRALLSAISSDQFVADAATKQRGEAVAYWLSARATAINKMKDWSSAIGASSCAP